MNFKSITGVTLENKTVILRADLNVPTDENTRVTNMTRIDRLKPTIDLLVKQKAKILILSHFGRPNGEKNDTYSLHFLPLYLEKSWGYPVRFAEDCIGELAQNAADSLNNGDIALLNNTRFYKGEEANDPSFAQSLASLGDIFVMDAFSVSHRAHASTQGITNYLPSYAGLLMAEELKALTQALEKPEHPLTAIVGGAKVSTKLDLLGNLIKKVDVLILGGGMANTFLKAKGHDIGTSLCEESMVETAQRILKNAEKENCRFILPSDVVVAEEFAANAKHETVSIEDIPSDMMILDAGLESIETYKSLIEASKTVVWNGPLGVFELYPFDIGTNTLAQFVAKRTSDGQLLSVAGGGDTVSALQNAHASDDFSYVSSAGGAFLEWLEGKTLPGVEAIKI